MVGLVTWYAVVLKKKWKCDGHIEARHIFLRKAQFGEPKTEENQSMQSTVSTGQVYTLVGQMENSIQ